MNLKLLQPEVQSFITSNLKSDVASLILKGSPFEDISISDITEQIEAKKRCEKKLPTWFEHEGIYYPNKLNIEQTSSEKTANYKAKLIKDESLIDITGGFGVDSYAFSKHFKSVTHCEQNATLANIAKHNFEVFRIKNIETVASDGIEYLKKNDQPFDVLYVDPSRRDEAKNKVFLLSDCTPNLKTFKNLFLKYAKTVLIKTSPLLDISATISDLVHVKDIHVVAVKNEVKELMFLLERDYEGEISIHAVNLHSDSQDEFSFKLYEESEAIVNFGYPKTYLYEPNVSVLKSGAFKILAKKLGVSKLHHHSHLYTSDNIVEFPGRSFKIETVIPFNKKQFSKLGIKKANVTTRNFNLSVHDIRKKLSIKDGGSVYLFFTTNSDDEKIIIVCSKL
ncbi:class I SAM-dependent methyltransferase [Winogradskyella maritima]|uniref:Class I SAM-dependent methyltransferase n=1 Tax=Winogradskyella maritima TaxID=1517766 RepID=A0ABV8AJ35_9FLAO|nr:class I SAM-dependent methyltransferase [Winogradskyella maritima]